MTRGIYHYALALLTLLPALGSCKQAAELEETSLTLSQQQLHFTSAATEQSISVQTTAERWSYLSPQEFSWFTLSHEGNKLKVKVSANPQATERTGVIAISSGGVQERLIIKQDAGAAQLSSQESSITIPQRGGSQAVSIHSNGSGLKAELASAADWLTITSVQEDRILLEAKPNTEKATRSVKLILSLGNAIQELEVNQLGTVSYYLPLDMYPAPLSEVLRYEQARGSVLASVTPNTQTKQTSYHFLSTNPYISAIDYSLYTQDTHSYYSARISSGHTELYKDNPDFARWLEAQGFKKESEQKLKEELVQHYTKESSQYALSIHYLNAGGVVLELQYAGKQQQAQATFSTVPMQQQLTRLGNRQLGRLGAARSEVRSYEEAQGSTLDKNLNVASYDRHYVKQDADGAFIRGYFYYVAGGNIPAGDSYIDHVQAVQGLYEQYSLAYYIDDFGAHHLTREVKQLLSAAGYAYQYRLKSGEDYFYNASKKTAFFLSLTALNNKRILQIQGSMF